MSKKWMVVQPLPASWDVPPEGHAWSIDPFYQISRLVRARGTNIGEPNIPMDCDIYFLISFNISLLHQELEFIRKVHAHGKKVVVAFSQDNRFSTGDHLVDQYGNIYTDLVGEADLTISGMSGDLHIYGRFQDKVIPGGQFLERLNFSDEGIPREIDVLMSGNSLENAFGFAMEIALSIKTKFPWARVVYSLRDGFGYHENALRARGIEVARPPLVELLKRSKVYIDHQIRPRPGRVLDEAWYCRTPFIAHEDTYLSRIFPQYRYKKMSIDYIMDLYTGLSVRAVNDRPKLITDAARLAEWDYWENVKRRIEQRLFPGERL